MKRFFPQISLEGESLEGIEVALAHRQKKGSKVVHSGKVSKTTVVTQESGLEPVTGKIPETRDLELSAKPGRVSPDQKDLVELVPRTSGVSHFENT